MKVLHIITSLEAAGAQWVLVQLLAELKKSGISQAVINMKPGGELSSKVTSLDIPLYEIPFSLTKLPKSVHQCNRVISDFQPDVIQSWLYHADFITIFLKKPRKTTLFWGVHHSFEKSDNNRLKTSTKAIVRINALFSKRIPNQIICCSKSTVNTHADIGYYHSKLQFIPNGVNVDRFQTDPTCRLQLRQELGLSNDTFLVGYVARHHPQKDHENFCRAAEEFLQKGNNASFVLVGDGIKWENDALRVLIEKTGFQDHFYLLGQRSDVQMITAGLDIATLAASGDEAFPVILLESMACGIPCVATNVGDVQEMIASCGVVVEKRNPSALAAGWDQIFQLPPKERQKMGIQGRNIVLKQYTQAAMAEQYLKFYQQSNELS